MKIVPLIPAHLDALHGLYLALVAPVPHCAFKPGLPIFRAGMSQAADDGTSLMVATVGRHVTGFAALRRLRPDDAGAPRDGITALFFADEAAGGALLAACEEQSHTARQPHSIIAFPNTHSYSPVPCYNGGWDGLSDRIPAVARLLARAGYQPFHRELHLTCDLERFPVRPGPKPAGITLVETADQHGRRTLRALDDNRAIGVCVFSTLQRMSDDPDTRDWGYVWGLGVEESYQRRGIGRFLLSSALARLHTSGCQGCWLTTTADNWPAQLLYLTLGFEVVDGSMSFQKAAQGAT